MHKITCYKCIALLYRNNNNVFLKNSKPLFVFSPLNPDFKLKELQNGKHNPYVIMFFNVIIYPSLLADDIKHLWCSSTKEKKNRRLWNKTCVILWRKGEKYNFCHYSCALDKKSITAVWRVKTLRTDSTSLKKMQSRNERQFAYMNR